MATRSRLCCVDPSRVGMGNVKMAASHRRDTCAENSQVGIMGMCKVKMAIGHVVTPVQIHAKMATSFGVTSQKLIRFA